MRSASQKRPDEESIFFQETKCDWLWQKLSILVVKFTARVKPEIIVTTFNRTDLNKGFGLNRLLGHGMTVFTADLRSESLRVSVQVNFAYFEQTHLLERLQLTLSIKREDFRRLGAIQVPIILLNTQLFTGIPHLAGCEHFH